MTLDQANVGDQLTITAIRNEQTATIAVRLRSGLRRGGACRPGHAGVEPGVERNLVEGALPVPGHVPRLSECSPTQRVHRAGRPDVFDLTGGARLE